MKKYYFYILLFIASLTGIMYIVSLQPKQLDWTPTYSKYDKVPLGTYVLYKCLPNIFRGHEIEDIEVPLYEYLAKDKHTLTGKNLLIFSEAFTPDKYELAHILDFAKQGNNVFITSTTFSDFMQDSLGFVIPFDLSAPTGDSVEIGFTNAALEKTFRADKYRSGNYFNELDSGIFKVLGVVGETKPNFIMTQIGQGKLYLNLVPRLFSNFNLTDPQNRDYAFIALSHLPEGEVLWDEYYRSQSAYSSPLRFILSQPALRWAYYILIGALIMYIVFEGKRRQRAIPVINPLKNTTVEFAETVGRLFYHSAGHKRAADKKIWHFFALLREKLHVDLNVQNYSGHTRLIGLYTGTTEAEVNSLFTLIRIVEESKEIDKKTLISLSNKIDHFYKKL